MKPPRKLAPSGLLRKGAGMYKENFYLEQDASVMKLLQRSLERSPQLNLPELGERLPEISKEAKEKSREHVSGHTILIRESSPEYYRCLTDVLTANRALLFYAAPNLDLFGRYGDPGLKEELRGINLRIGTNMAEQNIGTNAASLVAESRAGVWTVGEQNYAPALHDYAFYAFPVHSKYNRMTYVVLAVRRRELDERIYSLFKLIEATECVFSGGKVTKDVIMKDAYLGERYGETQTENLFIIIDSEGRVTYANKIFYHIFGLTYNDVINYRLKEIVPELGYASDALKSKGGLPQPRQLRFQAAGLSEYYVTCSLQDYGGQKGLIITAQKTFAIAPRHGKSDNGASYVFDDLIGASDKFTELKNFAERIADTDCTVLIRGESGTGKELFAHSIHNASRRSGKPFISVNCAAIPRELIGSELFGYVSGAFTGASRSGAKGKFEQADGGTLFLDEIGEMPIDMQSVLLRVLEDGQVTRLGSSKAVPVNVRLIAATNQNLEEYIKNGRFRLDLFYRLNIISLNMLPLREHREDISVLTDAFIQRFSRQFNKLVTGISLEARQVLDEYDWPGNVRQLRNVIERGVVTAYNGCIERRDLPPELYAKSGVAAEPESAPESRLKAIDQYAESARRRTAIELMQKYDGNKSKVAKQMGIARTTLYRLLEGTEYEKKKTFR